MTIEKAEQLFTYELGLKYLKDREKEEDFYFCFYEINKELLSSYTDEILMILKKDFDFAVKKQRYLYPTEDNYWLKELRSFCIYDVQDWTGFLIENNVLIKTA